MLAIALLGAFAVTASPAVALPPGFTERTIFTGLDHPTAVRFAPDGRVFVAEKSGLVKVFDSLTDTTPTQFADLRTNVHNFWDRGLLGARARPRLPGASVRLRALHLRRADRRHRSALGRRGCDHGRLPDAAGCDDRRLRRQQPALAPAGLAGQHAGRHPRVVLVHDWCQQFPSHSIGDLVFGADGALYASGGEGAAFHTNDWGQLGGGAGSPTPSNPCGDPPGGIGVTGTPPTTEGGSLRAQDLRTPADPVTLDGSVIRIDPDTGAARAGNPLAGSADANARRIVAHGFRNPFRLAARPGTNEIWVSDVGDTRWEEINRIVSPTAAVSNFGWPCYEGAPRQPNWDFNGLNICENLYVTGGVTAPFYAYAHNTNPVVPGDTCITRSRPRRQGSPSTPVPDTRPPTRGRSSSPTTPATASGSCVRARAACPT